MTFSIYEFIFQNSDLYIKTARCKSNIVHKLNSEKKRELGFAINSKISNVTYDPVLRVNFSKVRFMRHLKNNLSIDV